MKSDDFFIYWIGEEFLGTALNPHRYPHTRQYHCRSCGIIYGARYSILDGKKAPYYTWSALCKSCSPDFDCPNDSYIPGALPFFQDQMNFLPDDAIRYQLLIELDYFYARTNYFNSSILPSRGEHLIDGSLRHG